MNEHCPYCGQKIDWEPATSEEEKLIIMHQMIWFLAYLLWKANPENPKPENA